MRTFRTFTAIAALAGVAACAETTTVNDVTTVGASSGVPAMSVTCPGGAFVSASGHGPVYINGAEAQLQTFGDTYWEASGSGITASISRNPDGSASVSSTGPGGANGLCT